MLLELLVEGALGELLRVSFLDQLHGIGCGGFDADVVWRVRVGCRVLRVVVLWRLCVPC